MKGYVVATGGKIEDANAMHKNVDLHCQELSACQAKLTTSSVESALASNGLSLPLETYMQCVSTAASNQLAVNRYYV